MRPFLQVKYPEMLMFTGFFTCRVLDRLCLAELGWKQAVYISHWENIILGGSGLTAFFLFF